MKKITSIMLGLSLILGTAAFAADEKPATDKKMEKKHKKGKKADDKAATPAPAK